MTERHGHVDELLDRYRTGELEAAQRERVEAHLAACVACRSALAGLEAFARTVERAYAAETSLAHDREPDWGRLRTAIVGRTSARAAVPRRSWLARHAPQAALAVLAFVALGVLWQQGIREPADAERALREDARTAAGPARPADEEGEAFRSVSRETESPPEPRADRDRVGEADRAAEDGGAAFERAPDRPVVDPSAAAAGAERLDDRRENVAELEKRAADESLDTVKARTGRRGDLGRAEPAPEVQAEAAVKAEAAAPAELERFRDRARTALDERDLLLAERALAQWRDSLAEGEDLPGDLRAAARALADSLADFLARRP